MDGSRNPGTAGDPNGRRRGQRWRTAVAAVLVTMAPVALAGCGQAVAGHASLSMYDPFRVGDLPAEDGPSGVRADAPAPTGQVRDTDHGEADRIALLATDDIAEFWQQHYAGLPGAFQPVTTLQSYDSRDPGGPTVCKQPSYRLVNAMYCIRDKTIFWDRGVMLPATRKYFGDMGIDGVLAHEYGHALQIMARSVDRKTPGLVFEQQADCFAGNYLAWVGAGKSPRFQMSTGDGLNHVLAGGIVIRDPLIPENDADELPEGHGSALDRIGAFQIGFLEGPQACAAITMEEITRRRGDLPLPLLTGSAGTGDVEISPVVVTALTDVLGRVLHPQQAPQVALTPQPCTDAETTSPASYCPATNTVSVDMDALRALGSHADEKQKVLLQGDNTAISALTSRYVLALQHQRGLPLNDAAAALRTACLTGVAQRAMSDATASPTLTLTGGDLDEAIAGLLTNGIVASDVNGSTAPAGFTRILAFRSGLLGDQDGCYRRF